jgi:hypothetical protein
MLQIYLTCRVSRENKLPKAIILSAVEQDELVRSLTKARLLLDPGAALDFVIRPARTGEASLVAARQSILYAPSHGRRRHGGRGLPDRRREGLARLRLLHVEPVAREKRYDRITLWTHTVLEAVRRIYARNGF